MSLNCRGILIFEFFSIVNTTVPHNSQLVESIAGDVKYAIIMDVEGQR